MWCIIANYVIFSDCFIIKVVIRYVNMFTVLCKRARLPE